jgi:uncharacterized membrane protein
MFVLADLAQIGLWALYIALPILALYFAYLIFTRAFKYMGFSSIEAVIIVFVSFLFGFEIILFGVNISNIYLCSYENWRLYINMGGAIIPILLSIYLMIKKKIPLKKIIIGIIIVTIVAFFVTRPVENRGIVASIPYAFLPALFASLVSIFLSWKDFIKAAPLAYVSGTIGVLIGADVFDMIFITGVIAVVVDGVIMFRQRSKAGIS